MSDNVSNALLKAEIAKTKKRIGDLKRRSAVQARLLGECERAEAAYRRAERDYKQHVERGPRFASKKKSGRPRTAWQGRKGLKLVAEVALIRADQRRKGRRSNDAAAIRKLCQTPAWAEYRGRERELAARYCTAREYWSPVETAAYWKEHDALATAMREAHGRCKATALALKGFPLLAN